MVSPMPFLDVVTVTQVARAAGVAPCTVNRWLASGKLPTAFQLAGIRGARLIDRQTAEAFIAARNSR